MAAGRRSMYALLMLLPQSEAFKTLHARLHSVPTVTLLKMDGQPPPHAPTAAWDSPSLRGGVERRFVRRLPTVLVLGVLGVMRAGFPVSLFRGFSA